MQVLHYWEFASVSITLKMMEMTYNLLWLNGLGSAVCRMCSLVGSTLVAVTVSWVFISVLWICILHGFFFDPCSHICIFCSNNCVAQGWKARSTANWSWSNCQSFFYLEYQWIIILLNNCKCYDNKGLVLHYLADALPLTNVCVCVCARVGVYQYMYYEDINHA